MLGEDDDTSDGRPETRSSSVMVEEVYASGGDYSRYEAVTIPAKGIIERGGEPLTDYDAN